MISAHVRERYEDWAQVTTCEGRAQADIRTAAGFACCSLPRADPNPRAYRDLSLIEWCARDQRLADVKIELERAAAAPANSVCAL
jgi:hypothetical protein